jgi:hypothetical protein
MATPTLAAAIAVAACLLTPRSGAAQTAAPPCLHCVECSDDADSLHVVRVRIYNQSRLSDAAVTALLQLAGRIWLPSGISIEPVSGPDAVTIVIARGEHPPIPGELRTVLGDTLFSGHHAMPYIRLWVGAAEVVANTAETGAPPFDLLPRERREAILARMLGAALAHELGHYLLDSARHSAHGVLRGGLSPRDLQESNLRLDLTPAQRQTICRVGKQSTSLDLSR